MSFKWITSAKKARMWDYRFCWALNLAKKEKKKRKNSAVLFIWIACPNPLSLARVLQDPAVQGGNPFPVVYRDNDKPS